MLCLPRVNQYLLRKKFKVLLTPLWKTFSCAPLVTKLVKCEYSFSVIKVIFYLGLVYQIHSILFLSTTGSVHRKLNPECFTFSRVSPYCSYLSHSTSLFSISANDKLPCNGGPPICLASKFKTNRQTKQVSRNYFSNDPNFEQSFTSPLPALIFSSTPVTITTSFCFSVLSIVAKLSWFGISNGSFIRKFDPFHHSELFTSLIRLVIRVAMSAGFIFVVT